jgi:ABC-type nickel/cobalt efflux system permease component RcnA/Tol biopolymer transport system component
VWTSADTNHNDSIEPEEQEAFLRTLLNQLNLQVGNQFLGNWEIINIRWGSTIEALSTAEENIQFTARVALPELNGEVSRLQVTNGYFPYYSITLFSLTSNTEWLFSEVEQVNERLTTDLTQDTQMGSTAWSSEAPDFSVFSGQQQRIPGTNKTIRDRLNELLMRAQDESGIGFTLGAIVVSLLLGMLHAFTPGHGKSVVAAYMIGAKGNWLQGITLGLIVSVTHTITVILVGLAVLFGTRLIQVEQVFPFLEVFSALLILILGIILLIQRYRFAKKARQRQAAPLPEEIKEADGETRVIIRQSVAEEAAPHPHIGPKYVPRHRANINKLEWRTLLALGTGGGLVPCPDAVAIFIIAASLNLLQLGVFMIIAFSIGISMILMVLGALIARGKQSIGKIQGMQTIITHAPLISAAVLVVVGVFLSASAFNRNQYILAEAFARPEKIAPINLETVEIAYLDFDENRVTQIFTTASDGSTLTQRTFLEQDIKSFILAPEDNVLFFTTFDQEKNASQIWSFNLKTESNQLRVELPEASAYNLWLTPDQNKVLFERTDLGDTESPYLVTNIYQWDLTTDVAAPMLSNTNLISFHPAFSPDQRLFTYFNPNANRYEIYAVDGSNQLILPTQIGLRLTWSDVDNNVIIYQNVVGEGKDFALQTYLFDLTTRQSRNISEETSLEITHALWVSGEFSLILSGKTYEDDPGSRIYHYDLNSQQLTELRGYQSSLPRFFTATPDGASVLYEQYGIFEQRQFSGVWRLDRDGTSLQLAESGRSPLWLVWSK